MIEEMLNALGLAEPAPIARLHGFLCAPSLVPALQVMELEGWADSAVGEAVQSILTSHAVLEQSFANAGIDSSALTEDTARAIRVLCHG